MRPVFAIRTKALALFSFHRRAKIVRFRQCVATSNAVLAMAILLSVSVAALGQEPGPLPHNFAKDHNQRLETIPEAERAWPVYREALLMLGPTDRLPERFTQLTPRQGDQLESMMAENREALAKLHEAAALPHLAYPLSDGIPENDRPLVPDRPPQPGSENPMMLEIKLIAPQMLQRASQWVLAEAAVAIRNENGDQLIQSFNTLFAVARHTTEPDLMITDNLARSIVQQTIALIREVLEQPQVPLTDAQLNALVDRIEAYASERQGIPFEGSLRVFKDIVQRYYTDDGEGSGWFRHPDTGRINRQFADRKTMLEAAKALYQSAAAEMAKPAGEIERFTTLAELKRMLESEEFHLLASLFPDAFAAYCEKEIVLLSLAGLRTSIAIELYRRERGSWPDQLDELIPQFTAKLPLDRFSGQPLRYRVDDGRPLFYSIGPDRIDGNTSPAKRQPSEWLAEWHPALMEQAPVRESDWIVWEKRQ